MTVFDMGKKAKDVTVSGCKGPGKTRVSNVIYDAIKAEILNYPPTFEERMAAAESDEEKAALVAARLDPPKSLFDEGDYIFAEVVIIPQRKSAAIIKADGV